MSRQPGVLIIVENLPVPADRRVWQEATALREAGYRVSVISPKGGPHTASYEVIDDIHVFRHAMPFEAEGPLGYALEYSWALASETVLALKAYSRVGYDVVQACNPPDTIFLLARFLRLAFGTRFVFDHHDINPELFEVKLGTGSRFRRFLHRTLLQLERWTFAAADASIATNETFRRIAIERGGMAPERVFVVRSLPDLTRFRRVEPDHSLRRGRAKAIGYVGIMGAQDGVDLLLHAMADLVHGRGRHDAQCVIVGSGTELDNLMQLAHRLRIADYVTFTGFLTGERLLRAFSTFDVGAIPDPLNTYNDKISMNKVFEYMALGIPFVQFDLSEGRKSAGPAALYAENNDPASLADNLARLLDDEALGRELGALGKARARSLLKWETERAQLLAAYDTALAGSPRLAGTRSRRLDQAAA